jgi:hypothetical protein
MVAERRRRGQTKAYIRAIVAISLVTVWSVVALSGFLLYVAPHGPRSGLATLLILTKTQWGDVHFWFSVVAIIVTVIHIAVDWRALRGCIRYLTSVERSPVIRE